ncbi:pentatricopeptide repeat-containing protein At3g20730-like [Durio zibethinus]|uniref:Pentatricopeptide repeat-containing protein At3g20730-like n=1 Tax=Durio zibethinus TaxID=66656 RepID=A0A6P5WJW2_DURZI|nr:pentatricopeptide repeat-containing protein At3g20730-like [Durio zibethinus]
MNIVRTKTSKAISFLNQTQLGGIKSMCSRGELKQDSKLIQLNSSFYKKILQLCINSKAKRQGLLVHSQLLENGYFSNVHLATKLIIFYVKFGDMLAAKKVFDKMVERTVVSWTAMISGYSQNGFFKNALLVFSGMRKAGFKGNQFSYGSALKACTGLRCLERGLQIQGCIEKGRFVGNLFVQSGLLDLHAKCGNMEDANRLFNGMGERDLVSWNVMIGGFALLGFADNAFQLLQEMMREGKIPDCFTLGSVLRVSVGGVGLMMVSQVHGLINRLGFESYNVLAGSLVDAYSKCGSLQCASKLYRYMPAKDVISCTALITSFAREGKHDRDALDLFKEIKSMQMGMDNMILCSVLNISANVAELSLGRQIHAFSLKCQPSNDVAMGNALIDMYAKSGEIKDANKVFNEMDERNVISWTSLIAGYGKHGYGHEAIALYEKMEHEGMKPNDVTFLSLLFACSHTGLINKGSELFNAMVSKYKILPRAEHLSCMVDLFARGGHLEAAYNLIHAMNIEPTTSLWGAILGASNIYGNIYIGEAAATHLFNIDPEKSVNYIALAGIYVGAGAWENAWETRKLMDERSAVKDPGYSFLSSTKKEMVLLKAH